MKIILASNNKNKIKEIKNILKNHEIISLKEAGIEHETIEDGQTFIENALKKAYEISQISGCVTIADDSGLCVDALNGRPGIFSARYSGGHGNDKDNINLILKELDGINNRRAHYTCAVALCYPDGKSVTLEKHWNGIIGYEPKGDNGFAYDPIFIPENETKTAAEMTDEEKNLVSHRALAFKSLATEIK